MKEFFSKNIKVIILITIVLVLSIVGVAFAYQMSDIGVNITAGNYNVVYSGAATLPTSKLTPIYDANLLASGSSSKIIKITFNVKGANTNPTDIPIIYDVSLTNLNLPSELNSKYLKWRLYKNNTQISEGNFSDEFDIKNNNRMVLTTTQQDLPSYDATADSYTFYIWISEACTGDITTCTEDMDLTPLLSKTISGEIRIELSTESKKTLVRKKKLDNSGANYPKLVDGLVPVMYDGSTWVTADTADSASTYAWYNYDSKKWANAVLVTNAKRESLVKNIEGEYIPGQIVGDTESEGVLAFYVWIPRFKYKVWNIDKEVGKDLYNAEANDIDIVFESGNISSGKISCTYSYATPSGNAGTPNEICSGANGDYYTHPAFTFGEEQINGFWIGKFELSSIMQTADTYGGGTSISLAPRILPDVLSWRNNTISNFSFVINNMNSNENIYGLSLDSNLIDSHMITNIEWGAVAILTHSEYGRCSGGNCIEVAKNNSGEVTNYGNYTGRSSGSGGSAGYNAAGTYTYKTNGGVLASTTGNVTGVYDMSGGAYEYVMGNMSKVSGNYSYFVSNAGSNYNYFNDSAKYLNTYGYGAIANNQSAYNRGKLGDVTSEVINIVGGNGAWYGDYAYFVSSSNPWFMRGGTFNNSTTAGIFNFNGSDGSSNAIRGTRAVLVGFNK